LHQCYSVDEEAIIDSNAVSEFKGSSSAFASFSAGVRRLSLLSESKQDLNQEESSGLLSEFSFLLPNNLIAIR
jgi:hypothetical protein